MSTTLERRIAQHTPAIMALVDDRVPAEEVEQVIRDIARYRPLTNPVGERKKIAAVEEKIRKLRRDIADLNIKVWPNPYKPLLEEMAKARAVPVEVYVDNTRSTQGVRLWLAANSAYNLLETEEQQIRWHTSGSASPTHAATLNLQGRYIKLTQLLVQAANDDGKRPSTTSTYRACREMVMFMRNAL